jgi:hypothetical protein
MREVPELAEAEGEIFIFLPPVFLLHKNPAPSSEGAKVVRYIF